MQPNVLVNVTTQEHQAILAFIQCPHLDDRALKAGFESILGKDVYEKMQHWSRAKIVVHPHVPAIPFVGNGKRISRIHVLEDNPLRLKA